MTNTQELTRRTFTVADRDATERRRGCWYAITADGYQMFPATHVGPRFTAHVSVVRPVANLPGHVRWVINDRTTGARVLSGYEPFWRPLNPLSVSTTVSFFRAARRALAWIRTRGCTKRVRPGDHRDEV